ncbi:hypothetical protein [Kocuria rosea]|uniref:hypothetical protein n=1 Tax=Kocuria rosea TaxID=1275 RepID=UPI0025416404|nr:hypothetical protein [Kocuria rosea]WIG19363.1 hypothetical protein QOY29_18175 [Kocuria rosea]
MELPTLEEMRRNAHGMLGDVEDELRSDWLDGTGPTPEQAQAARQAKELIGQAKNQFHNAVSRR